MDEKRVESMVDEVLAQRRMDGKLRPAEGLAASTLRHPLMLTIMAFIFTTVVGGFYDQVLKERDELRRAEEKRDAADQRAAEQAVEGVKNFAKLVYERSTRAELLRWAVRRADKNEAIARKEIYDEVFVRWNMELPLNLRRLGGYMGDEGTKSVYDLAVENTIDVSFTAADECLTFAYDTFRRNDFPHDTPHAEINGSVECRGADWQAFLHQEQQIVIGCITAILDSMIPAIRRRILGIGDDLNDQVVRHRLSKQCPDKSDEEGSQNIGGADVRGAELQGGAPSGTGSGHRTGED